MTEIKEKFPNPEQQNVVIAKLYEDTEVNPLLGCLPSFLQIPVFIALYRSILRLANEDALCEWPCTEQATGPMHLAPSPAET